MKKYHIGYVFDNGGVIVDGPQDYFKSKNSKKQVKWKVKCPNCNTETWKFSNTLQGLKYPCKRCYDNSLKIFDQTPAIKKAFISLKSNAKSRKLEVQITEKEFADIASNPCEYCGAMPVEKTGVKEWHSTVFLNGIDRVDSKIGYTLENSVSCCQQCNWAKKDLTLEEWNNWIDMLIKNRKDK